MRISISILSVFLALAFGVAQAQGYRWVDKDGKVRYGDVPPPGVKATPLRPVRTRSRAPSWAWP